MCGVVGVVLPNRGHEAAAVAATALFALQHRGQESAGVGVSDGRHLMIYKDLGMVGQVLDERRIPSLAGDLAVAHCRYSTTGSTVWENAQPTLRLGPRRALAIGHNGNLVNTRELLEQLEGGRGRLSASTDTELLTALLADEPADDTVDALRKVLPRVRGAFSLVVLDEQRVIGVRDPHGFRPLVLGRLPAAGRRADGPGLWGDDTGGWILASETAALDIVGAELRPGRGARRDRGPRARAAARLRALRRGDARAVRVRAHLLRPAGLVHAGAQPVRGAPADGDPAGRASTRSRRTSSCPCRTRVRRPRPGSRRRPASRTARAWSATATAAGRSSSRPRRCASAASTSSSARCARSSGTSA